MQITRRTMLGGATGAVSASASITAAAATEQESTMNALHHIRHLDYTVLFARDMDAMREFYGGVMGFEVNRELQRGWIEYRVGSCLLVLTEHGVMFDDPKTPKGALSAMVAFRVTREQVDQCAEVLESKGVKLVSGPTDQPWAHRTIFFRDPDGNILEIYADM
jgi:lactoylglutathione lyase